MLEVHCAIDHCIAVIFRARETTQSGGNQKKHSEMLAWRRNNWSSSQSPQGMDECCRRPWPTFPPRASLVVPCEIAMHVDSAVRGWHPGANARGGARSAGWTVFSSDGEIIGCERPERILCPVVGMTGCALRIARCDFR